MTPNVKLLVLTFWAIAAVSAMVAVNAYFGGAA